jgi:hypothetical protein
MVPGDDTGSARPQLEYACYLNVGVRRHWVVATTRPPIRAGCRHWQAWSCHEYHRVERCIAHRCRGPGAVPAAQASRSVEVVSVETRRRILIAVMLTVLTGAILAAISARRNTLRLLLDDNLEKLKVAEWAPPMIRDYLWFGVGRGAFESVFPAYKTADSNTIYSHPENFLVQWATEWGVPVTLLLVVVLMWLLRPNAWGAGGARGFGSVRRGSRPSCSECRRSRSRSAWGRHSRLRGHWSRMGERFECSRAAAGPAVGAEARRDGGGRRRVGTARSGRGLGLADRL